MSEKFRSFGFFTNKTYVETEELSYYNGYIANEGYDYKIINAPDFSNSFATPEFGNNAYYIGITKGSKTFPLKLILKELTMKQYRQFLNWIGLNKTGWLVFDYMRDSVSTLNYGYKVRIESISESVLIPVYNCDTSNYSYSFELDVTFITTDDWAAQWIKNVPIYYAWGDETPTLNVLIDNEEGNNFFTVATNKLKNNHNLTNYYEIYWEKSIGEDSFNLTIKIDGIEYYEVLDNESVSGTIYTKFGFVLDNNNNFVTMDINLGIFGLEPEEEKTITFTTSRLSKLTIKPISREIV